MCIVVSFSPTIKGHVKLEDGLNIRDLLDLKDAFMVRIYYHVTCYNTAQLRQGKNPKEGVTYYPYTVFICKLKPPRQDITEGRSEKITYPEFKEACQTILGASHEEQLKELYLQVDVAGEGHIDWVRSYTISLTNL
eukprot:sb/3474646/